MDQANRLSAPSRRAEEGAIWVALRPSLEGSWALGCACLAARSFPWRAASGFRILTAWLIADVVCGCILAQLVALKRASLSGASPLGVTREPSFTLTIPYALPGSPGQRLADLVNGHMAQWRSRIWPQAGRCGLTALVGTGLALVLATYLGRVALAVLSFGLLLAAGLMALAGRDEGALAAWLGGLHLALAWALGHLALAPWHGPAMALAVLVGLHACARRRLREKRGGPALWLLWAIWAILTLALLMARQPILAALMAIASLAEGMSAGAPPLGGAREVGEDRLRPPLGWLLAMLLVALAMPYWA